MSSSYIFALVLLVLILPGFAILYYGFVRPQEKKKEEATRQRRVEDEEKDRRNEERSNRYWLQKEVLETFAIELDTIDEISTQNEIVRIVNLMAHETATACVNQDKAGRGEEVPAYYLSDPTFSRYESARWGEKASKMKIEWSKTRKLALQVAPKLEDRMPHFSEFEPLKSYNAKYLRQKAEKRAVS